MFALDPGQHGGDVAVLAIKRKAALLVMPGETREAALDRANRQGRGPIGWVGEAQFRYRGPSILVKGAGDLRPLAAAPTAEMRPVGFVGGVGIFAQSLAGIILGGINQPIK